MVFDFGNRPIEMPNDAFRQCDTHSEKLVLRLSSVHCVRPAYSSVNAIVIRTITDHISGLREQTIWRITVAFLHLIFLHKVFVGIIVSAFVCYL